MPVTINAANSAYNGTGPGRIVGVVNIGEIVTIASDGFLGAGPNNAALVLDNSVGSAPPSTVTVDGFIFGNGAGSMGMTGFTGAQADLTVGATGVIMVRGGVFAANNAYSIHNNGLISNDSGDAIRLAHDFNFVTSAYFSTVVNTGTISAGGSGFAILSQDFDPVFPSADTITNSGLINGFVDLGGGDDVINNTGAGRITKAVHLGAGLDQYTGSAGAFVDTVFGDAGNDTLRGNGGNDVLNGGLDSDRIYGGLGNDSLSGGLGADFFVFNTKPSASNNRDTITDYNVAADTIRLENAIFTKLVGAANTALSGGQFFKSATATAAHDLNDRIIYNTATGALYYDADGNKTGGVAAVKFATLTGSPDSLTQSDFFII